MGSEPPGNPNVFVYRVNRGKAAPQRGQGSTGPDSCFTALGDSHHQLAKEVCVLGSPSEPSLLLTRATYLINVESHCALRAFRNIRDLE